MSANGTCGQKVLGGLHVLGRHVGDAGARAAVALFDKEIRDLERLRDLLPVGVKIELDTSPLPAPIKAVVVGEECRAGPEGDDEATAALGFGDCVGSEKPGLHELAQVRPQLLLLDFRWVFEHREPAEPFGADVVIAFGKREAAAVVSVVQIGEVKKEPHVERLPDRAELLHQSVIEAGEVSILQRCHDGPRERHGARLDRIGGVFAPL